VFLVFQDSGVKKLCGAVRRVGVDLCHVRGGVRTGFKTSFMQERKETHRGKKKKRICGEIKQSEHPSLKKLEPARKGKKVTFAWPQQDNAHGERGTALENKKKRRLKRKR